MLNRLVDEKHLLAIDEPLSERVGKPRLYRVADSNLRFYLGIGRSLQELIRRGRSAQARTVLHRRRASWRGWAVQPMIREALSLSAGDLPWPEATAVGGWWNRALHDLAALRRGAAAVPGFEPGRTALVAVSRAGVLDSVSGQVALSWGPGNVVAAYSGRGEPAASH